MKQILLSGAEEVIFANVCKGIGVDLKKRKKKCRLATFNECDGNTHGMSCC